MSCPLECSDERGIQLAQRDHPIDEIAERKPKQVARAGSAEPYADDIRRSTRRQFDRPGKLSRDNHGVLAADGTAGQHLPER